MNNRKTSQGFAKVSLKTLKYVIIVMVAVICATTAYRFGSQIFSSEGATPPPGTDLPYTISAGTTISELADELEEFGIIKSSNVFLVQSYIYNVRSVTPGTYNFNTSNSAEEIFRILSDGPEEKKEEKTTEEQ